MTSWLDGFPCAVAGARAQVDAPGASPQTRRGALHFTVYQLLRSATLPLIGQYLTGPAPPTEAAKAQRSLATALAGLRSPHFADWIFLAGTLAKHGPRLGLDAQPAFGEAMRRAEALAFEVPPEYAPRGAGTAPRLRALDAFHWLRNGCAHSGPPTDAACLAAVERYRPRLDELLGAFEYLTRDDVLVLRGVLEEAAPRVQRLRGPEPPPAEPLALDYDLRDAFSTTPVIVRTAEGRILPLFPLLHGHLRGEPLSVYDGHDLRDDPRQRRRTIYYLGQGTRLPVDDDESPAEAHADAGERLSRLLAAKGVRLELAKEDVKPWTLAETANDFSRRTLLDQLGTKYLPACWLERPAVMDPLRRFLGMAPGASRARAFLLTGPAGSGKTAALCRLAAEELGLVEGGAASGSIVIFARGDGIHRGEGGPALFPDLAHKVALAAKTFPGGFAELFSLLAGQRAQDRERPDRRVVVLLDALNEARHHETVMREALDLVRVGCAHPFVRIVLSVRAEYLDVWRRRRGGHEVSPFAGLEGLFVLPPDDPARPRQPEDPPAWVVPPLSLPDAETLYGRYQAAAAAPTAQSGPPRVPATRTPWARVRPEDRQLLIRPLNLHLWMETFDGREATPLGSQAALFRTYLDATFARRDRLWEALRLIADRWLEQGRSDLDDADANELRTRWATHEGVGAEDRRTRLDPLELAGLEGLLVKRVTEEGGGYRMPIQLLRELVLCRRLVELGAGRDRDALATWAARATFPDLVGALALVAEDLWQADRPGDLAGLGTTEGGLRALVQAVTSRALSGEAPDSLRRRTAALAEASGDAVASVLLWEVNVDALAYVVPLAVLRALREPIARCLERLANAEPDRADLAHDLSVSLDRLGDLERDAFDEDGASAHDLYQRSLEIRQRLADAEPDSIDRIRAVSVSYERLGALANAGDDPDDEDLARDFYQRSLEIAQRLVDAEPDRADLASDLAHSLERLGDVEDVGCEAARARDFYQRSLEIRQRLADAEPGRADLASNLAALLATLGDRCDEEVGARRELHQRSLEIRQRLAEAEPDCVDLARAVSDSFWDLGSLARYEGDRASARDLYQHSVEILQRLADAEPHRLDLARSVSISLRLLGDLESADGDGPRALDLYQRSLEIAQHLAEADPDRVALSDAAVQTARKLHTAADAKGDFARARNIVQRTLERIAEARDGADLARALSVSDEEEVGIPYDEGDEGSDGPTVDTVDDMARDVSISLRRLGALALSEGDGGRARTSYRYALEKVQCWVKAVPTRSGLSFLLFYLQSALGQLVGIERALNWRGLSTEEAKRPGPKKPKAKRPAAMKPTAKRPAAKKPAAKRPAAKKPAAKTPAARKPAAKKPAAKKPAAYGSTTEKPANKAPSPRKPRRDDPDDGR